MVPVHLFLSYSFVIISVSGLHDEEVRATKEGQCIDYERNVTSDCVCPNSMKMKAKDRSCMKGVESCCIYKVEGEKPDILSHDHDTQDANHSNLPYCGSQRECAKLKRSRRPCTAPACSNAEPSLWDPKGIFIVIVFMVGVATAAHRRYKMMRKLKQREIDMRRKLDAEFPPVVYGNAEDVEGQSGENEVCCICLDGLEGAMVRKLHCNHVVHQSCFDQWCLHSSKNKRVDENTSEESLWTCPFCKQPAMTKVKQPEVAAQREPSMAWVE